VRVAAPDTGRQHRPDAPTEEERFVKPDGNVIRGPGGSLALPEFDEASLDLLMLIEGETSGAPLDEVLARVGRSRSTYYEKLRRFREQGLEGLIAQPTGPRGAWRRPLEVVRFIVRARLRNPERSAAELAEELSRLGHTVSLRSVERTLTQFGLTRRSGAQARLQSTRRA
jgi:transposase